MNVNIYTDSANHPKFVKMLNDFAVGVRRVGDNAHLLPGKYQEADVHVIFGSWKDRDKPWHNVKRDVVAKAQKYIVIETPLVGRGEVKDVGDDVWYRVGLNGFLADTGNFNNSTYYRYYVWRVVANSSGYSYYDWGFARVKLYGDYY